MLGAILGLASSFIGAGGDKKAKKQEQAQAAQDASANNGNDVKIAKADLDALVQKAAANQTSAVPGQNKFTG